MRALALAACLLGGCGGAAPLTGVVVAIDYDDGAARIEVSGAAEASGRRFGPWSLTRDQLASGGTVGFVFGADDAGSAMICAQSFDDDDDTLDYDCGDFDVRAGEVTHGQIALGSSSARR